jgi:membrane fusion protein (multidrug efflux system)
MHASLSLRTITVAGTFLLVTSAIAQVSSGGPPAVGVITAEPRAMTESTEINGRIQAPLHVDLIARVTAFLNEISFVEGAEVKKGDVLFRLESAPFEADVEVKQAALAQAQAQLENANLTLTRAQELLQKNAGTQVAADSALATQRTAAAQVKAAQAQLHQSQINLDYTEIKSPIGGRMSRASLAVGNVVGPTSGALATVVGPDPMYVVFPVAVRRVLELRKRYADKGGLDAVKIRLRLPTGEMYDQTGTLKFVDVGVANDTDTIILRGTIANPAIQTVGDSKLHELTEGEFVTVSLEAAEPLKVLAVPRGAILSDQQGDYLYVVNAQNTAEQRRVKLGQSTPEIAAVLDGLKPGEKVVVEGIQRVRPNLVVAPAPASATPGAW